MGRHRFTKSGRAGRFKLWDYSGDKAIRHDLDWQKGCRMVKDGQARALRSEETNAVYGFQLLACRNMVADVERVPVEAISQRSCVVISRAEREAIAGLRGESRTAGLTEEHKQYLAERARREFRTFEMDDLVQRAREKLGVYAVTH